MFWFYKLFGIKRYQVCYRLLSMGSTKKFDYGGHMSLPTAKVIAATMAIRYPNDEYFVQEYKGKPND